MPWPVQVACAPTIRRSATDRLRASKGLRVKMSGNLRTNPLAQDKIRMLRRRRTCKGRVAISIPVKIRRSPNFQEQERA